MTNTQLCDTNEQRYEQYNFDRIKRVLAVVESPLAVKLYLYFVSRLNDSNRLLISHSFITSYFNTTASTAIRALTLLNERGLVRIKSNGQGQILQVSFNDTGNQRRYLTEDDVKIAVVSDEWGKVYGAKR